MTDPAFVPVPEVNSKAAAFTFPTRDGQPWVHQRLTTRFGVPRYGQEGAFDVVLRLRIPQAYWNTYANGGAMPGPLVFALLAQCTVGGVVSNYERVKLLSAVTYEEPQTELID